MAIPFEDRGAVDARINSLISRGNMTEREIINDIGWEFGLHNDDFLAILQRVRAGYRRAEIGGGLERDPTSTVGGATIPVDNTLADIPAQIGYTVLVTFEDEQTGEQTKLVGVVFGNDGLTADEISDMVHNGALNSLRSGADYRPRGGAGNWTVIDVVVIRVGRRP